MTPNSLIFLFRLFILALLLVCFSSPIAAEDEQNWIISDDNLLPTPDGATLSLLIVRPDTDSPLPVALNFTIYANQEREKDINQARFAARKGYIGVIAYARGKHLSNSTPRPYETESSDVNVVIDWLGRQPWSDGRVAMYGGSYDGFSQWAAAKNLHPAVKTMVPYVAAIPGYGLPMENGIFLNANYGWPFHVTNNHYKDDSIYQNRERWSQVNTRWFESGRPYRHIDRFDHRANYWLHTWLDHPDYDQYWQSMVPVKQEFAKIDIPILSITGYFDDGQVSALRYLQQHELYHAKPNHYLVIGPYDHWSAQRQPNDTLRDIRLDPVAKINVPDLTFKWFDYVLKNGAKPRLLNDKINYQVMGSNRWHSASSLHQLNHDSHQYFLNGQSRLSLDNPLPTGFTPLQVDLTDRQKQNHYYPWPIVNKLLNSTNGLVFESPPLMEAMIYAGQFSAQLNVRLDRKDVDLNLVLYERTTDNRFIHLSYYLGRASYAADISQRQLLTPGIKTPLPVSGTRMNGKLLEKGSKLVLVVSVNKNDFAQVNFGSGKDVSDESIYDAFSTHSGPLKIDIFHDSFINIPLKQREP